MPFTLRIRTWHSLLNCEGFVSVLTLNCTCISKLIFNKGIDSLVFLFYCGFLT